LVLRSPRRQPCQWRCERILTVFREQIVGATDDKFGYQVSEFLESFGTLSLDCVRGISVSALNDSIFEILPKIILSAKEIGIGEIKQGEIFREIILSRFLSEDI
jgi:hypothetical protein